MILNRKTRGLDLRALFLCIFIAALHGNGNTDPDRRFGLGPQAAERYYERVPHPNLTSHTRLSHPQARNLVLFFLFLVSP